MRFLLAAFCGFMVPAMVVGAIAARFDLMIIAGLVGAAYALWVNLRG